jgi:hypothetical protein
VTNLAIDLGTATTKAARDGQDSIVSPAAGDRRDAVSGAIAGLEPGSVAMAVPEAWLDGSVAGTTAREALSEACAGLGLARVTWTGQLSAIAALTARQRGDGRYLVADIGATGVRVAMLDVTGPTVRIVAVDAAAGAGWNDFDAALRARATGGPLPADWYLSAREQDRAARAVLTRAMTSAGYRESAAYTFPGASLLAGQVIDSFAPTARRLHDGAGRVRQDRPADVVVLAGGLSWFPLAGSALAGTAGQDPVIVEPDAAARGALLFARGAASLAPPPELPPVVLPVHRIRDGELEELGLPLPWTEPFATPPDGPVLLDEPILAVDVGGRRMTVELPGLRPGPCQVGVRAGWSGASALVVRPGEGPAVVAGLG